MGLTVTILGRCGSYPGPGEACSGYLVQGGGSALLIDAGSGTLANLQRHVALADLDGIVITHEHPDHWTDLTGLFVAYRYYLKRDRIPVFAPASVSENVYYKDAPFEWQLVADGSDTTLGGLRMRFSRTDHPPETLAIRVDADGRSMAFSADTGPKWSFDRLGAGINLGLCEATFLQEHEGKVQHLSARQAGAMAKAAGIETLLLTHLEPGTDPDASRREAAGAFGRDVTVAEENEVYEV